MKEPNTHDYNADQRRPELSRALAQGSGALRAVEALDAVRLLPFWDHAARYIRPCAVVPMQALGIHAGNSIWRLDPEHRRELHTVLAARTLLPPHLRPTLDECRAFARQLGYTSARTAFNRLCRRKYRPVWGQRDTHRRAEG